MLRKEKLSFKRNEIITCPYFRIYVWVNKEYRKIYDLYCKLDNMIFYTYRSNSNKITEKDKKLMQSYMRQNCASDCPKLWNSKIDDDDFDMFSKFGEDYFDDPFESDYLINGWKSQ